MMPERLEHCAMVAETMTWQEVCRLLGGKTSKKEKKEPMAPVTSLVEGLHWGPFQRITARTC